VTALLSNPSRRIAFAIAVSLLLHGWLVWGPSIRLPQSKPALPPLMAKLQPLPAAPAKPRRIAKRHTVPTPEVREAVPAAVPVDIPPAAPAVAAEVAASAVEQTPAMAAPPKNPDRPLLPHRAQLTFVVNKGTGSFQIGEAVHTLEIDDGHYVLQSVTRTVGMARLFKNYQLTQYSSGSYTPQDGLQPEEFFEERAEQAGIQHTAVEFERAAQRAHFSQGLEAALPADTQDILSIMYQFPPLSDTEIVSVSVANSRKIERYQFEITPNEDIDTPLGRLQTVHLRKIHQPNEEGLEIWLAREYRLFPVKIRIVERNGDVSGEIIITDIRVEDAPQETKQNAAD
jgi:hypothetical protein